MASRARITVWCAAVLLAASLPAGAQDPAETPSEELQACPPPEGACAEDVVSHVLAEKIGGWQRQGPPISGGMEITPALTDRLDERARGVLDRYRAACGAATTYHNTTGPGVAQVLMIGFEDTLSALGFFAAQRTESAERVLLTSAAYRDQGILHVYSCAFYFRVEVREAHEGALPSDQYLAARLEVRLPQREELPRIIRLMPRGWVNALTVSYEPTDVLGEGLSPMAVGARQTVGGAKMRLQIVEAPDEAVAARWYAQMLERSLDRGRAWEVAKLGQEAFFAANGGPSIGMLQDQFVAHLTTDGKREDAEAIMRLVGTAIRITRPLPDDAEEYCPPLDVEDTG